MTKRHHTKYIHEGNYVAEVDVELIDSNKEDGWSPYLSLEDAYKLDEVRQVLRKGDLNKAAKISKVFRLTPVAV